MAVPSSTLALNSGPKQQLHRSKRSRNPNRRSIKIHRNYTVEEAARVTGCAKVTIRALDQVRRVACDCRQEAESDPLR
jgi:hypothetical protein